MCVYISIIDVYFYYMGQPIPIVCVSLRKKKNNVKTMTSKFSY